MARKKAQQNSSLVTFLLDRSGSMGAIKAATIEGFNGYLGGLKAEKDATINFTFLTFDTGSLDKICVAEPVGNVAELTNATFQPRGGTPLIDAAVKTINATETALAQRDTKTRVVVCIQTDGEENSSTEHTWEELRALVAKKQSDGWEFVFMGAGIDAYAQGAKMGIGAANTVSYDHLSMEATRSVFAVSAENTGLYARGATRNMAFSASQKTGAGDRFDWSLNRPSVLRPAHSRPQPASLDLTSLAPAATPARRKTVPDLAL